MKNCTLSPKSLYSFILLAFILTHFSCKKYEEGPAVSLRTKKARITGDWTMEAILRDGKDVTNTIYVKNTLMDYHVIFEKDGRFVGVGNAMSAGSWEFGKKKETLVLKTEPGNTVESYFILRLTEKELWLAGPGEGRVTRLKKVK